MRPGIGRHDRRRRSRPMGWPGRLGTSSVARGAADAGAEIDCAETTWTTCGCRQRRWLRYGRAAGSRGESGRKSVQSSARCLRGQVDGEDTLSSVVMVSASRRTSVVAMFSARCRGWTFPDEQDVRSVGEEPGESDLSRRTSSAAAAASTAGCSLTLGRPGARSREESRTHAMSSSRHRPRAAHPHDPGGCRRSAHARTRRPCLAG
jgi:hypothetical protein